MTAEDPGYVARVRTADGLFLSPAARNAESDAALIRQLKEDVQTERLRVRAAVHVLRSFICNYDPERAVIDVEPDPGCLECTAGTTPHDRQTGLCAYHKALRAIAAATGGE